MKRSIIVLFSIIFPLFLTASSALEYFQEMNFPGEWREGVTKLEQEVLKNFSMEESRVVYQGNLLRLYLVLSGAGDENKLTAYEERLKNFLTDLKKTVAYSKVKEEPYYLAELLLSKLHEKVFRVSLQGKDAGDNIGVTEVLDNGNFNCFMSALLYNALLAELGIVETGYQAVPEHIYSVIKIKGKWVPVETTNKFGFDPELVLKPSLLPRLIPPTIRLLIRAYKNPIFLTNEMIVLDLLNNRSLVYSGKFRHSRLSVSPNSNRALFYAALADYLSQSRQKEYALLFLNRVLDKLEAATRQQINLLPQLAEMWSKLLSLKRYEPYQKEMYTNWNTIAGNASNDFIRKALNDGKQKNRKVLAAEFQAFVMMAQKSIIMDDWLKNRVMRNLLVYLNKLLEDGFNFEKPQEIFQYGELWQPLWKESFWDGADMLGNLKRDLLENFAVKLYNAGINLTNEGKNQAALEHFQKSLAFLKERLKAQLSIMDKMEKQLKELAK